MRIKFGYIKLVLKIEFTSIISNEIKNFLFVNNGSFHNEWGCSNNALYDIE